MSVLLQAATRFIVQIMLLLAFLLVLRGHNHPGGGFIGALIASAAIALYTIAFGLQAKRFAQITPWVIALGLLCLLVSLVLAVFWHEPILTGLWWQFSFMGETVKVGTPLLFDFGIFFLIAGSLSWFIAALEDKQK